MRVAIDDFGTGYSSLAYLQRFPSTLLKIDRSFISKMSNDAEGETLIRTLVQLGKSLSIETLAEGIEQAQELACCVRRAATQARASCSRVRLTWRNARRSWRTGRARWSGASSTA